MSIVRSDDAVPTVSVLLPVYNAEHYLRAAVESVLSQTLMDFELLAFDDGSKDRSLAILHEYGASDSRVNVFSRENRGQVPTLNELVGLARGRYLARLDADDICLPERFRKQVDFLDSSPEHLVVGGWVELINAAGQPIGVVKSPISHDQIDQANIRGLTSICHPTAMIRKTAIISAGYYNEKLGPAEDLDLWLRLAEIGKVANLPEVVLRYRLHANSLSEAHGQMQQDAAQLACVSAWRRRGIEARFEAVDHWRPTNDKDSQHKFALRYGWSAWNQGHTKTWWTYACEAMRLRPLARSSWRLLVFGFLKNPRRQSESEN
jgi:glycosyltransferase involved in cell wall biosynthesis